MHVRAVENQDESTIEQVIKLLTEPYSAESALTVGERIVLARIALDSAGRNGHKKESSAEEVDDLREQTVRNSVRKKLRRRDLPLQIIATRNRLTDRYKQSLGGLDIETAREASERVDRIRDLFKGLLVAELESKESGSLTPTLLSPEKERVRKKKVVLGKEAMKIIGDAEKPNKGAILGQTKLSEKSRKILKMLLDVTMDLQKASPAYLRQRLQLPDEMTDVMITRQYIHPISKYLSRSGLTPVVIRFQRNREDLTKGGFYLDLKDDDAGDDEKEGGDFDDFPEAIVPLSDEQRQFLVRVIDYDLDHLRNDAVLSRAILAVLYGANIEGGSGSGQHFRQKAKVMTGQEVSSQQVEAALQALISEKSKVHFKISVDKGTGIVQAIPSGEAGDQEKLAKTMDDYFKEPAAEEAVVLCKKVIRSMRHLSFSTIARRRIFIHAVKDMLGDSLDGRHTEIRGLVGVQQKDTKYDLIYDGLKVLRELSPEVLGYHLQFTPETRRYKFIPLAKAKRKFKKVVADKQEVALGVEDAQEPAGLREKVEELMRIKRAEVDAALKSIMESIEAIKAEAEAKAVELEDGDGAEDEDSSNADPDADAEVERPIFGGRHQKRFVDLDTLRPENRRALEELRAAEAEFEEMQRQRGRR